MSYETTSSSSSTYTTYQPWSLALFAPYTRPSNKTPPAFYYLFTLTTHCFLCFLLCRHIVGLVHRIPTLSTIHDFGHLSDNTLVYFCLQHLFFFLRSALIDFVHIFASRLSFRYLASFSFLPFSADRLRRIDTIRSYFATHSP